MQIRLTVNGTSPVLMHNPQMVDPMFELNRQIKEYTSKRKKTDADLKAIERLEWYGGLYHENGRVVLMTSKIRKSIVGAARMFKQGKTIERALGFNSICVPLIYEGPQEIDKLYEDERFISRLSVCVNGNRVMRTRPKFPEWSAVLEGYFIEDVGMNIDEFKRIAELAGRVEGIGDNRINGYGRYEIQVEVAK